MKNEAAQPPPLLKVEGLEPPAPHFSTHDSKFAPILNVRVQPSHAIESAYIIVNQPVDHNMAIIRAIQATFPAMQVTLCTLVCVLVPCTASSDSGSC